MTRPDGPDPAAIPPTRLLLIYRGDGGLIPTILDALKKSVSVEESPPVPAGDTPIARITADARAPPSWQAEPVDAATSGARARTVSP